MKLKKLSIICAALTSLLFTSYVFADNLESFIRKAEGGGFVSQSIQTTDGNYAYLNGHSIKKLSTVSGNRISEISFLFDVPEYGYVSLRGIAQTSNGFVIVGYANLNGYYGVRQGIVVKVDSEGRIEWTRSLAVSGEIEFEEVISTTDGGFIVTASTYPHVAYPVVIKFNSGGDVVWLKSFYRLSYSFQSKPTLDGGIILAADLIQNDERVIGTNVIKIDGSGNIVWAMTLEMEDFSLQSLTALSDHGFLLAGKGTDPNKLLLVYLNSDGTVRSKAAYSLDVPAFRISSLAQTQDGGVAIGGELRKKSGSAYDGFLLKINDRQKLIFQKRLGFRNSQETISSVIAKEDGNYLLFGSMG